VLSLESSDSLYMPTYLFLRQNLFLENARVIFNRHASASDKILSKTVALAIGPKSLGGNSLVTTEKYIKELMILIEKRSKELKIITKNLLSNQL